MILFTAAGFVFVTMKRNLTQKAESSLRSLALALPMVLVITQSQDGRRSGTYYHLSSKYSAKMPVVISRCEKRDRARLIGGEDLQKAMRQVLECVHPERIDRLRRVRKLSVRTGTLHKDTCRTMLHIISSVLGETFWQYVDDIVMYPWQAGVDDWKQAKKSLPLVAACANMTVSEVSPFLRFISYCDVVGAFARFDIPRENVIPLIENIVDYLERCFGNESEIRKLVIPRSNSVVVEGLYNPKKPIKNVLWFFLKFRPQIMDALEEAILLAFSKQPTQLRRFAPDKDEVLQCLQQRLFGPAADYMDQAAIWSGCYVKEKTETSWGRVLMDGLRDVRLPLGYLNGFIFGRGGESYQSVIELLSEREGWKPSLPVEYKRSIESPLGFFIAQPLDWKECEEDDAVLEKCLEGIQQYIARQMSDDDPTLRIHFCWYCVGLEDELSMTEKQNLQAIKRTGIPVIITYGNVRVKPLSRKFKVQRINTTDVQPSASGHCLSFDAVIQEIKANIQKGSDNATFSSKYDYIYEKCLDGRLDALVSFFAQLESMTSLGKSKRSYLFGMFKALQRYTGVELSDKAMQFMAHFMDAPKSVNVAQSAGEAFIRILTDVCETSLETRKVQDENIFQRCYKREATDACLAWNWDD